MLAHLGKHIADEPPRFHGWQRQPGFFFGFPARAGFRRFTVLKMPTRRGPGCRAVAAFTSS